jgi:hypothetical protein
MPQPFKVVCNDSILEISPYSGLSSFDLERVVLGHQELLWEMYGEVRSLPRNILEDAMRVLIAQQVLESIGRSLGVSPGNRPRFTRDQTLPLPPKLKP